MSRRQILGISAAFGLSHGLRAQSCRPTLAGELALGANLPSDAIVISEGSLFAARASSYAGIVQVGRFGSQEQVLALRAHRQNITALAWAGNSDRLLTGGADGVIKLWSTPYGQLLGEWKAHDVAVALLAVSADGAQVATASVAVRGSQLRFWSLPKGGRLGEVQVDAGALRALALSGGGRWIGGLADGGLVVGAANSRSFERFTGHGSAIVSLDVFQDRRVATIDQTGAIAFWTLDPVRLLSIRGMRPRAFGVAETRVYPAADRGATVTWTGALPTRGPGVPRIAFGAGEDEVIATLPSAILHRRPTAPAATIIRVPDSEVSDATLSPDEKWLLTAHADGAARIWSFEDGAAIRSMETKAGPAHAAAFSTDGQQVVLGCGDARVRVYSAGTGTLTHTFPGHKGPVTAVGFSPDGRRVLSMGNDATLCVWALSGKGKPENVIRIDAFKSRQYLAPHRRDSIASAFGGYLPARKLIVSNSEGPGAPDFVSLHWGGSLRCSVRWQWSGSRKPRVMSVIDHVPEEPRAFVAGSGLPVSMYGRPMSRAAPNLFPAMNFASGLKLPMLWIDQRRSRVLGLGIDGSLVAATLDGPELQRKTVTVSGLKIAAFSLLATADLGRAIVRLEDKTWMIVPMPLEPPQEDVDMGATGLSNVVALRRGSDGLRVTTAAQARISVWNMPLSCP